MKSATDYVFESVWTQDRIAQAFGVARRTVGATVGDSLAVNCGGPVKVNTIVANPGRIAVGASLLANLPALEDSRASSLLQYRR